MNTKKVKVVWVCHFSNAEVQSLLPLWKNKDEFASWIPNTLVGFENREDIEIHVISPHEYLKKDTKIRINGISYYFLSYGIPFYHRHWPGIFRFDLFTDFFNFRRKGKNIIKKIKPDLINIIGAENAYYSSIALDLYKKYPVLITIQGFISEFRDQLKKPANLKKRIQIEEQILATHTWFSGDAEISPYISKYNTSFQYFPVEHPANEALAFSIPEKDKIYDCIYFGRLVVDKGIVDFIRVIAELKKKLPGIKACVIGSGNADEFIRLAKELHCFQNIEFVGFVKSQKELFEYVKASKVFLAPPLIDRLSSTIREAMLLKVPVVSYATGAIPSINSEDENIFLVETGDFLKMAQKTLLLLQNVELSLQLAEKAFLYYQKEFSLEVSMKNFLSAYKTILDS